MEDWTEARDILRCNPNFHQRERYDSGCVIINNDTPEPLSPVSVHYYDVGCLPGKWLISHGSMHSPEMAGNHIRCGRIVKSQQKPGTLLDYVVQGALMYPIFDSDARLHYFIDTVDGDMFLCVNNLSWCDNMVTNDCQIVVSRLSTENAMTISTSDMIFLLLEAGQDL